MAVTVVRKRSPRAPLVSLREAVDRVSKVYEKEGRHPVSVDIVAQHLGYKSADNGAAKQIIATLGYYGLVERPADGMLAVTKSVEEFKFAPSEELRAEILQKWLLSPGVFAELLEKFQGRLPSEASLKFELMQKGFKPATADECLAAFVDSVKYVTHAGQSVAPDVNVAEIEADKAGSEAAGGTTIAATGDQNKFDATSRHSELGTRATVPTRDIVEDENSDRIPVRLAGGRRAWLVIPSPFYAADKRRLISQIELLLADDEE